MSQQPSPALCFIARLPCGCVAAGAYPHADIGKSVAGWLGRGMKVERVTAEEMIREVGEWVEHWDGPCCPREVKGNG